MDEQDLLIAELREQLELVRRERDEFRDLYETTRKELMHEKDHMHFLHGYYEGHYD